MPALQPRGDVGAVVQEVLHRQVRPASGVRGRDKAAAAADVRK